MANFVAKQVLTAAALNEAINSLGTRGTLSVSPKINGSASGISGDFSGAFCSFANAITAIQIKCSFTSIGSNSGELSIDIDTSGFFNAGSLTSQSMGVSNVARLSGVRLPINTALFGIIQGKNIRVLSSQYNGNPNRVLTNQDLSNTSYFELSAAYITGN